MWWKKGMAKNHFRTKLSFYSSKRGIIFDIKFSP